MYGINLKSSEIYVKPAKKTITSAVTKTSKQVQNILLSKVDDDAMLVVYIDTVPAK